MSVLITANFIEIWFNKYGSLKFQVQFSSEHAVMHWIYSCRTNHTLWGFSWKFKRFSDNFQLPTAHSVFKTEYSEYLPATATRYRSLLWNFDCCNIYEHMGQIIGPILWGHSGPLCHALSLLSLLLMLLWTSILHCHSPGVATVARRLRYS